jgi:hypothetical protein
VHKIEISAIKLPTQSHFHREGLSGKAAGYLDQWLLQRDSQLMEHRHRSPGPQ